MKAAEIIECNDTVNKKEFKQMDEGKKGTVEKEKNVWKFVREMPEKADEKETW